MEQFTKQVFEEDAADVIAGIPILPCPICETMTRSGLCSSQCVRRYLALPEAEKERLRQPDTALSSE